MNVDFDFQNNHPHQRQLDTYIILIFHRDNIHSIKMKSTNYEETL